MHRYAADANATHVYDEKKTCSYSFPAAAASRVALGKAGEAAVEGGDAGLFSSLSARRLSKS
jgi:hypothetical protein